MANIGFTIKSSSFRDGIVKDRDGSVLIDMRGDKRLDAIQSLTREAMYKNGWKLPENEKEVSEKIAELMHRKEFYGPYNDKSLAMQEKLAQIQGDISDIELNKHDEDYQKRYGKTENQFDERLEVLKKQEGEVKQELVNDTKGRNLVDLKNVKSGETVCFHQALIMSKVMDGLGAENDLCADVHGGSMAIGAHVFVQSREGNKNIIDPTKDKAYMYNISGGQVRDGEVVLVSSTPHAKSGSELSSYGGGKTPNLLQRLFPDKYLKDELEENQPTNSRERVQAIIEANVSRAESKPEKLSLPKDVDAEVLEIMKSLDKGIFGRGVVSAKELENGKKNLTEEQIEILEKAGISFDSNQSYNLSEAVSYSQNHKPQQQQEVVQGR